MPGTSSAHGPGADGPHLHAGERSSWAVSTDDPDWLYPDHPSWPEGSTGRPLTPDHPSWPTSGLGRPIGYGRAGGTAPGSRDADHPSWPANTPGRPVANDDYPSWPAADPGGRPAASAGGRPADRGPGGPRRELPGEPLSPSVHHDRYPQLPAPQVPPVRGRHVRVPAGYSGYPRPGVPTGDTPRRWSAQLARSTGPIPQAYYDLAPGDGHTGPIRVAERVLADADQQAAAIRQEAASEAAAIRQEAAAEAVAVREGAEREAAKTRQQAAAEAAPIREAAKREAAELKDQAAAQVAAIREAADREIAELRATVLAMSDELRRVAGYVTKNLTSQGQPPVPPPRRAGPHPLAAPARPDAEPSAEPVDDPPGKPGAGPGAKRRGRPGAKPAGKPGTSAKGRQVRAMRKMVAAFVAVSVVGVVAGAAQIALHGFPFFVFRANGAGASLTGLKEDQGPGQPGAPGAHRKAPAATPGATAKAHHPGAKSEGKKSHGKKPQNKQHHGKQHHGKQPPGQQGPKSG